MSWITRGRSPGTTQPSLSRGLERRLPTSSVGVIIGQFVGVNSHNDSNSITNHGTIDAVFFDGVAFSNGTNNYLLDNDGTIHGHNDGIESAGTTGTCTINNTGSGLIS